MALDSSRTPSQLEVRDGELLYLRPRGGEAPMLVFDDVVDAVATATNDRAGQVASGDAPGRFGLAAGHVALLAGAAVLLFTGPPQLLPGLIGLGIALAMLVVAVILSRAVGDSGAGVVFAAVAMVYAAVGGLLISAGDRSLSSLAGPHVLLAVTAVLLVTVVAAIGVADAAPFFLAIGVITVALELTAAVCLLFDVGPARRGGHRRHRRLRHPARAADVRLPAGPPAHPDAEIRWAHEAGLHGWRVVAGNAARLGPAAVVRPVLRPAVASVRRARHAREPSHRQCVAADGPDRCRRGRSSCSRCRGSRTAPSPISSSAARSSAIPACSWCSPSRAPHGCPKS